MALPIVDASHTRQSSLWRNDSRCILGTAFWSFLTAFVFYFNFLTLSMGGSKKKKRGPSYVIFRFFGTGYLGYSSIMTAKPTVTASTFNQKNVHRFCQFAVHTRTFHLHKRQFSCDSHV